MGSSFVNSDGEDFCGSIPEKLLTGVINFEKSPKNVTKQSIDYAMQSTVQSPS